MSIKGIIDEYISSIKELSGTQVLAFLFAHNMCVGKKDVSKVWDSFVETIEIAKNTQIIERNNLPIASLILSRILLVELKKRGMYLISVNESESDDFDRIYGYAIKTCGEPWTTDPYEIIKRFENQEHRES